MVEEGALAELIVPLGVVTYSFIVLTIFTGIARWKLHWRWAKPIYHFILGSLALGFATLHAAIVLFAT